MRILTYLLILAPLHSWSASGDLVLKCQSNTQRTRQIEMVTLLKELSHYQTDRRAAPAKTISSAIVSALIRAALLNSRFPSNKETLVFRLDPMTQTVSATGIKETSEPQMNDLSHPALAPSVQRLKLLPSYKQLIKTLVQGTATRGHLRAFLNESEKILNGVETMTIERPLKDFHFTNRPTKEGQILAGNDAKGSIEISTTEKSIISGKDFNCRKN